MYNVSMVNHEHNIDYVANQAPVNERSVDAPGAAPVDAQGLGSQVVPWAVEQHPYDGPGAASASDTRQTCIDKLERPPKTRGPDKLSSVMLDPNRTEIQTTGTYWSAPNCTNLKGLGQHRAQLKVKGHWTGIEGDGWYPVGNSNGKSFNFLDLATRGVKEEKVNGHWEPAREQFRVVVRDPRTGKIISTGKIKNFPVKIEG